MAEQWPPRTPQPPLTDEQWLAHDDVARLVTEAERRGQVQATVGHGARDTVPASLRRVPKPKMVMRSQYVPLPLWEQAKAVADENDENISDAVRIGLELYIKKRQRGSK